MHTIVDLHRRAALIEQALDDLDAEEEMVGGADLAVIEAERETLSRLLTQIEERLFAVAA